MENKNLKPTPANNNSNQAADDQSEDLLFYNVMPKVKSQEAIVEPTLKISQPSVAEPAQASKFKMFLSKYKIYLIFVLILAIAGPIVYIVVNKYFGQPVEEDLLVSNPKNSNKPIVIGQQDNGQPPFSAPKEWRDNFFAGCSDINLCGDDADPDHDGLNNLQEFQTQTDPNNADSDQDGLADGDEIYVFGTNPLSASTSNNIRYTDADYIKGGFSVKDDKPLSQQQIDDLGKLMRTKGLHQPTIKTLDEVVNKLYHFDSPAPDSTATTSTSSVLSATSPLDNFDQSLEAKQDRDAQRANTIKNMGIALIKYQATNNAFPKTTDFKSLYNTVKVYSNIAINPVDPINIDPYVYTYTFDSKSNDYTLTFYSEVANQVIKKHSADAIKDKSSGEAAIYDDQRRSDLESIRTALLVYSNKNIAGTQDYVFPPADKYKTALVPDLLTSIPKDPKTGQDYEYQVSDTFDTFTIRAVLGNPAPGTTGYLCNQEECRDY